MENLKCQIIECQLYKKYEIHEIQIAELQNKDYSKAYF